MLIIPVIDLCRGLVVHAKKGERSKYQVIESTLTSHTEPAAILEAYFKLYPFKNIYIADLDAIQNKGEHYALIKELAQRYPDCEFWIDAGLYPIQNHQLFSANDNIRIIIGSENELSEEQFEEIIRRHPAVILSLDFGNKGLLRNGYLLEHTERWPEDVIILMLHRVGSNEGCDRNYLDKIKAISIKSKLYAAGGIRDLNDIRSLEKEGFDGVLLATALHNGSISKDDLTQFFDM